MIIGKTVAETRATGNAVCAAVISVVTTTAAAVVDVVAAVVVIVAAASDAVAVYADAVSARNSFDGVVKFQRILSEAVKGVRHSVGDGY